MTPFKQRLVDWARAGLGLLFLAMLAGCANSPPWVGSSKHPSPARIQAVLARLDHYVYFPRYGIYHNTNRDQYVYWDDYFWVTRPEPPQAVSVAELEASPSVAMNFNDAPERHHAAVAQTYPRNWQSPGTVLVSAR